MRQAPSMSCRLNSLLTGLFSARSHLAALTFLQFHKNVQHLIESQTCIQEFVARTPQLHMGSFSSELYAAPTAVADESLQQPSYVEFTWSNLAQRRGASASFVAAHTRCAPCFVRLFLLHNRISIAFQSPRALVKPSRPALFPHESLLLERQIYERVQHTCHVTLVLSVITGTQINGRRVNRGRECGCRG